jgi:hypothetical protein
VSYHQEAVHLMTTIAATDTATAYGAGAGPRGTTGS